MVAIVGEIVMDVAGLPTVIVMSAVIASAAALTVTTPSAMPWRFAK